MIHLTNCKGNKNTQKYKRKAADDSIYLNTLFPLFSLQYAEAGFGWK